MVAAVAAAGALTALSASQASTPVPPAATGALASVSYPADGSCALPKGFSPSVISVGLVPTVTKFAVNESQCSGNENSLTWELRVTGFDVDVDQDAALAVFDPLRLHNIDATLPGSVDVRGSQPGYGAGQTVYPDGLHVLRQTTMLTTFKAPASAASGAKFTVSGHFYVADWDTNTYDSYGGHTLSIRGGDKSAGTSSVLTTARTASDGTFSATITMPNSHEQGPYKFSVTYGGYGYAAPSEYDFTVDET
jgi:hypothetical protein